MATCDMGYDHADAAPPAEPEVVVADPGPNENDVRIAEIEAEARIEAERIWTEQQELALQAQNEELRGELRGMREVLDRLVPPEPAEPEPVVVETAVTPAEPEEEASAPPEVGGDKKSAGSRKGFF